MKYCAVIVTYNRLPLLKECLSCVEREGFDAAIIVNNASTDGTAEVLAGLDARFNVLQMPENLGGAGGFCEGLKAAADSDCDYVLIIDDDAMLEPGFLQACDAYLAAHPGTPAVSGTVKTEGEIQLNHRRDIGNQLLFSERNVPLSAYEKETFTYHLSTFCGLMISRAVLQEIGLPKAEFFIWFDDTEFSMRLPEIVNVNSAVLNHKCKITQSGASFYDRMNWRTYYGHRNRYVTTTLHCSRATQLACRMEYSVFILGAYLKNRPDLAHMLMDSRRDALAGRLGKNPKYLPGK